MGKTPEAFRTISEVAGELDIPKHVLRFWEQKFSQIRPMKRGGGRRYYRPEDLDLLRGIRDLLHTDGYTIKGVQRILRERGVDAVKTAGAAALAAQNDCAITPHEVETKVSVRPAIRQASPPRTPARSASKSTKNRIGETGDVDHQAVPSTHRDSVDTNSSSQSGSGSGQPMDARQLRIVHAAITELQVCRAMLVDAESDGDGLSQTAAGRSTKKAAGSQGQATGAKRRRKRA
ncbi:MAG: MerR family transcriptional regulator [Hyphomicrobiaceae bacterium]